METTRWTNPTQPQTLQSSVILLYVTAVLSILFGGLGPIVAAARIGGGFGCANERKWGYQLALAGAALPLVLLVLTIGLDGIADNLLRVAISFAFDIVLVALLLHPETRSYQRIWFR